MQKQPHDIHAGFSLIQISILLTVASLLLVTVLPSPQEKVKLDAASAVKMDAIMLALRQYQAAHGVLPCPADPTQPAGSDSYGVASANTGTTANCVTGTAPNAAYADTTNHIAIGMVPIRTLGLSYDYALDAYGRDITYAVDTNTTAFNCNYTAFPGAITVSDNGAKHNTVVALVSHGQDGYGAWLPLRGTSGAAARFNNGSTDTGQAANAQVTSGTLTPLSTFTSFIKQSATSTFDDFVVYGSPQFNMNAIPQGYVSSTAYQTAHNTVCTCSPTYRAITIDHTKVGAISHTDQSNFPMLFSGTYSYLATQANGGSVQNSNGYDIKFTSDAAGTHILPYEQESYNSSTGAVNYWVLLDSASPYNITLSHTADTVIYLQYCTANQANQSNPTAVWTTGNSYQGAWHFNSIGAKPYDSTNLDNSGVSYTSVPTAPSLTTGPIGNAINLINDEQNISIYRAAYLATPPSWPYTTGNFTVSMWINKTTSSSGGGNSKYNYWAIDECDAVNPGASDSSCTWGLSTSTGTDDCPSFIGYSTTPARFTVPSSTCLTTGKWYYLTATRNSSTWTIYVNGVQTGQTTGNPTTLSNGGYLGIWLGRDNSGGRDYANAAFDEVRLSPSASSADWINTEYNNQAWPDKAGSAISGGSATSGFYTVGPAISR